MNEFLLVRIGAEFFGIDLTRVEEAVENPTFHFVPEQSPMMLGVLSHRGALISAYSAQRALSVAQGGSGTALILRTSEGRAAIAVDEVEETSTLATDDIELRTQGEVILGVAHRDARLISIIDVDALLAACRSTTLAHAP